MLSKEFNIPAPPASNPTALAGWQAERDLAFFLDRAFKADPGVHLFHSLRLKLPEAHAVREEDFAQIDHLILHRHGLIIIESKSLTGKIEVNDRGEFCRSVSGRSTGIPSPLHQARRQADALRRLLSHHQENLRGKVFGLVKGGFKNCPIQPLIAISTHSIITGSGRTNRPEVLKADAIPDAARGLMERHRKGARLLSLTMDGNWGMYSFTDEELPRLCAFFIAQDTPVHIASPTPPAPARPTKAPPTPAAISVRKTPAPAPPPPSPATLEPLSCRHCRSINVTAVYAKDYCLRCTECNKYTPLDYTCPACHAKARIRKDGPAFRRECPCGHNAVFWRNP
jgi:hypothetical protein